MLLAVFLIECGFLAFAFVKCSEPLPDNPVPLVNERCPRLGQRSQEIFQQAMAVTLSLLGGGALAAGGFSGAPSPLPPQVKKKKEDDPIINKQPQP